MKKRGFTLIELLAVIVILAIIALIATPMILGVIDSSKKGAFESSARGIIKAAESDFITKQLTDSSLTYPYYYDLSNSALEYKGKKFQSGIVLIEQNSTTLIQATDREYCANGTLSRLEVSKEACSIPSAFYEALDFDGNQMDNSFYKKLDQLQFPDGTTDDYSKSLFQIENDRLQIKIEESEKNDPNLHDRIITVLEFTTPNFESSYEFSFQYEYDKKSADTVRNAYHNANNGSFIFLNASVVLLDNLNNNDSEEEELLMMSEQELEEQKPQLYTVKATKQLKANTKHYLLIYGPIAIDSIHLVGATLKEEQPSSYYFEDPMTYVDAGATAYSESGEDVSEHVVGILGPIEEEQFHYRYFFQTKKGIQFIERTLFTDLRNLFEFDDRGRTLSVSLKEELSDYTVEIFEDGNCYGSNSYIPMKFLENNEPMWYYVGVISDSPAGRSCSPEHPRVRILKNGVVLKEESFMNLYQKWIQGKN